MRRFRRNSANGEKHPETEKGEKGRGKEGEIRAEI